VTTCLNFHGKVNYERATPLSLFPGHTLRSSLSPSSSSTLYYFRFEAGGGEGDMNRVENHTVQKPKCQEGAILFVHKRDKKKDS
jgi:hypothetical protein